MFYWVHAAYARTAAKVDVQKRDGGVVRRGAAGGKKEGGRISAGTKNGIILFGFFFHFRRALHRY